jgi:hypothetical protein
MKKLLMTLIAVIALAVPPASAQELWTLQSQMPTFLTQQSWCHERGPAQGPQHFRIVPGCESLVVKQDALVFDGSTSCKLTTAKSFPEYGENWWLKGYCRDEASKSYVGDFRFYESHELNGERLLIMLTPPYMPMARMPK